MVLLKRDSYDISAITEHEILVEKGLVWDSSETERCLDWKSEIF